MCFYLSSHVVTYKKLPSILYVALHLQEFSFSKAHPDEMFNVYY
jgi:hypothetical protein